MKKIISIELLNGIIDRQMSSVDKLFTDQHARTVAKAALEAVKDLAAKQSLTLTPHGETVQ